MGVEAKFTANILAGDPPLAVQFTDLSTGGPDQWLWDFGDGYTSALQNPSHIYTEIGVYSVTLRVTKVLSQVVVGASWRPFVYWVRLSFPPDFYSSNELAHAGFISHPLEQQAGTLGWAAYRCSRQSGFEFRYAYGYFRSISDLNLSAHGSGIAVLETRFAPVNLKAGAALFDTGAVVAPVPPGVWTFVQDISWALGSPLEIVITDVSFAILPSPGVGQQSGWAMDSNRCRIVQYGPGDDNTMTKDGYIEVGVGYCGSGWIMVSYEVLPDPILGNLLVVATTDKCHLWMDYMTEFPDKSLKWRVKYGMKYRCSPHYDLSVDGTIEQTELGDTHEHTFILAVVPPVEDVAVIVYGQQCGVDVASKSPLIRIDNT